MPRFCGACNRPLTPAYHDMESGMADPAVRSFVDGLDRQGRPRVSIGARRQWICRMRLIGKLPTGRIFTPPRRMNRVKIIDQRYVHTARLEPGGDLHA